MNCVKAEQLVYSRVEREYSPHRTGGFQTVWKSGGLNTQSVATIEEHVQCFDIDLEERLQFFHLGGKQVVLARTRKVSPHGQLTDRTRRTGNFVVHCLILARREFLHIENNPFVVIDAEPFQHDLREFAQSYGQASGEAPQKCITISGAPFPSSSWSGRDVQKVIHLALSAESLKSKGKATFLRGASGETEKLLRLVFHLIPRPHRLHCTFDTQVDRCTFPQNSYWAVGALTSPPGDFPFEVDLADCQIRGPALALPARSSCYLAWLDSTLPVQQLADTVRQVETIRAVERAFRKRDFKPPASLDWTAAVHYCRLNPDDFRRSVTESFGRLLSKRLANQLACFLLKDIEHVDRCKLVSALYPKKDQAAALGFLMVEWISREPKVWKRSDLRQLLKFALRSENRVLQFWGSTLGKRPYRKGRDQALQLMSRCDYEKALFKFGAPIAPVHFVHPKHLDTLLKDPQRLNALSEDVWVELVASIAGIGEGKHLAGLAGRIRDLSRKSRARLRKVIYKGTNIAPEFKRAFDTLAAKDGPVSWFSRRF